MYKRCMAVLLCTLFTAALLGTLHAQDLQKALKRVFPWKGPEIGSVAQDFELKTFNGKTFKLSDNRGKITVLEMGACT